VFSRAKRATGRRSAPELVMAVPSTNCDVTPPATTERRPSESATQGDAVLQTTGSPLTPSPATSQGPRPALISPATQAPTLEAIRPPAMLHPVLPLGSPRRASTTGPFSMDETWEHDYNGPRPFDVLIAVDGQPAATRAQIEAVLGKTTHNAVVKFARLPFGRINPIASSDRGWIFLERFVSMIKVAMDPHGDDGVIGSNSTVVAAEIHDGAARLAAAQAAELRCHRRVAGKRGFFVKPRGCSPRASPKHKQHSPLREVLQDFTDGLKKKRFSAVSTDCIVKDATVDEHGDDDATVVACLMAELVQTLQGQWQIEKAKAAVRKQTMCVFSPEPEDFSSCGVL